MTAKTENRLSRMVWKELTNKQAFPAMPDIEELQAHYKSGIFGFVHSETGEVLTTDSPEVDKLWADWLKSAHVMDEAVCYALELEMRQKLMVESVVQAWAKVHAGGCWGFMKSGTDYDFTAGQSSYWTLPLHLICALMNRTSDEIIYGDEY
jgi:hypothetical protein